MGCRVVGVFVCALATTAVADTPPTTIAPHPAPPDSSWYGSVAPAAPPSPTESVRRYPHRVDRGGAFLLAGVTHIDTATKGRVDIGVPTPLRHGRRLRTVVIAEIDDRSTDAFDRRDLSITPELQYDWRLFHLAAGDLVLVAGLGLQWSRMWVRRPDEPFWPSSWESSTGFALRVDAALQYRGRNGLVVSIHPVSAAIPLDRPEPPDARWMSEEVATHYGLSLTVGYQFQ